MSRGFFLQPAGDGTKLVCSLQGSLFPFSTFGKVRAVACAVVGQRPCRSDMHQRPARISSAAFLAVVPLLVEIRVIRVVGTV